MRKDLIIAACCLLALQSCGKITPKNNHYEVKPIPVETYVIDTTHSSISHTYVGEVEENSTISLNFTAGGTIEHVFVHEGQQVKKGQLLASIDKQNAENAYKAAKATLDQAEDGYKRLKQVYEQGSVAEVKWIEMNTNLEKARSMEAIASKQLHDCDLYAPCSGFIGSCNAKVGENALPGQQMITLLDVDRVHVSFTVPENEISSIELGRKGMISIAALGNALYEGEISDRSLTANKISHSYKVKIALENKQKLIMPGMVCKVYLDEQNDSGYVIPANAIQTRPDGLSVWICKNGTAQRRYISARQYIKNGILVRNGLNLNDTIITSGYQKLFDGAKIIISE